MPSQRGVSLQITSVARYGDSLRAHPFQLRRYHITEWGLCLRSDDSEYVVTSQMLTCPTDMPILSKCRLGTKILGESEGGTGRENFSAVRLFP